jgi:hypothetical protein
MRTLKLCPLLRWKITVKPSGSWKVFLSSPHIGLSNDVVDELLDDISVAGTRSAPADQVDRSILGSVIYVSQSIPDCLVLLDYLLVEPDLIEPDGLFDRSHWDALAVVLGSERISQRRGSADVDPRANMLALVDHVDGVNRHLGAPGSGVSTNPTHPAKPGLHALLAFRGCFADFGKIDHFRL